MVSVLIVEDDRMTRKLIRRSLEAQNYKVVEATNGEEALERFSSNIIDLAILDVNIGQGMDGFDVCRSIRKDIYGGLIPIIFMTAEKSEKSVIRGFEEGADGFIRKPCSMAELVARVKALSRRNPLTLAVQALCKQDFTRGSIIKGKQDSYQIKHFIEQGGMGAVFLAERLSDNSLVAIKTIMPQQLSDQSDLKRFLREAKITTTVRHRNIANGIEIIRSEKYLAFVMEYIEGYTLEEVIKIKKHLTISQSMSLVEQIAQALHHLDEQDIMHRDVQPKNIIVAKDGRAVLIDMGISKAKSGSTITKKDIILGTIAYIAPELIMTNDTEVTGDIYSLGLIFFYALTGQVAYNGENMDAIMAEKLCEEVSPKFLGYDIPQPIFAILEKMTFKKPEFRYQKFTELIKDLQNIRKELKFKTVPTFE